MLVGQDRLLALFVLTGCEAYSNRGLVKAAQVVRIQAMHLLASMATCLDRAIADRHRSLPAACRLNSRKKRPNTSQLLLHPDLLGLG